MDRVRYSEKIKDIAIFSASPFLDFRGKYIESFNSVFFEKHFKINFVQDDFSISKKNVLRGLHGDAETWKLVTCAFGEIYFVVADMREESETFLVWESFLLSPEKADFVLVPPGFANGHLVLTEQAVFQYKQTTYYGTQQFTVKHDDPRLNIFWPNVQFIKSERDS